MTVVTGIAVVSVSDIDWFKVSIASVVFLAVVGVFFLVSWMPLPAQSLIVGSLGVSAVCFYWVFCIYSVFFKK
jgi:hypothetical protein